MTTADDIIEAATHLMHSMPQPDGDGVFDEQAIEEWEQQLENVFSNMRETAHVYRTLADKLMHESHFVASQEELLRSRRKMLGKKREFVIARLRAVLEAQEALTGKPKIETVDKSWVGIRRSARKVVHVAEGVIAGLPSHFTKQTVTPDKVALMNCYKDTPQLLPDGVRVEESHSEAVMWPGKIK